MYKGQFIVPYKTKEIHVIASVIGDDMYVGELGVLHTLSNGKLVLEKIAADTAAAALNAATHIVAQGDMTQGYGHALVENADYRYDDVVKCLADATGYTPSGNNVFHGVFAKSIELPTTAADVASNDTALVYSSDTVFKKYVATKASTTVTWAVASQGADIATEFKNVALYKITNKSDVNAYDGG